MRFLLDAQLPPALTAILQQLGHDAQHVRDVGLRDSTDPIVWDYALRTGAAILTKDEDFAARRLRARDGPIVIWLRIGNCSRAALAKWLIPLLGSIEASVRAGDTLIEVR